MRVAVRQLPDCLVAEVEDDGRGFQLNRQRMPPPPRGLGLLGMRERVAIAGGIADRSIRRPAAAPRTRPCGSRWRRQNKEVMR